MAASRHRCKGPQDGASAVPLRLRRWGGCNMRIFRSMSVVGAAIVISAGVVTLPLATHAAAAPAVPPGAIDQNFGAFGGQAAFGSGITSALDSVEMDSKQRIIAAAAGGGTLFIYRLTSTGTLDSSFGPDGTFTWANAAGNGGDL